MKARVATAIPPILPIRLVGPRGTKELDALLKKHQVKCEKCKGPLEEVAEVNMTFPLKVGTAAEARTAYLTPETAQGAYVNFRQMF